MISVLKLNQSYEPIEVISWKDAIRLIFLEKAEIVNEYDKYVKTPQSLFKLPAVIRLNNAFSRPRKRIKFNRRNIIRRDKSCCQYCGEYFPATKLTLDHVIPRSKGGKTDWGNIVSSCSACNLKKGSKTLIESGMRLRNKPITPDWMPIELVSLFEKSIPEEWKDFCYGG